MARRRDSTIGIDIALDSVRVAELNPARGMRIGRMAALPLGMGALGRDDGINWVSLENTLGQLLKDFKVKGRRVHVSIPAALTVVRQLSLPDLSDEELREVISFELTNSIHLPFEETVFDFVRCPNSGDDNANGNTSVILIAADKALLDELVTVLKKFNIRVSSIDVRPLATLRVLKRVKELPASFLLVESDSNGAKVHVFHEGLLYLTRQVPVELMVGEQVEAGDGQASSALARDASFDQAFDEVGTTMETPEPSIEQLDATDYVARFAAEIDRTINFFRYTLGQRSADFAELLYVGYPPLPATIREALSERIGLPIELFSFEDVLESGQFGHAPKSITSDDANTLNDFTAAVGLALREV